MKKAREGESEQENRRGRPQIQRHNQKHKHKQQSGMTQEIEIFRVGYEDGFREYERVYVDSSANVDMMQDTDASINVDMTQSETQVQCPLGSTAGDPPPVLQESLAEEVDRYVELCERGQFYDWMMEQFGIPREKRDRFKRRVFKYVMFGRQERSRHSNEWKLFEKAFPHIARLIGEIKRQHGHSIVAHLLQHVESSLMINRVCRRLMEKHQEVPVVTIHDSILTTKKNVSLVRNIIQEEFFRLGLQPSLHEEDYANTHTPVPTVRAKKRARRKPPAPHTRVTEEGASDDACASKTPLRGSQKGRRTHRDRCPHRLQQIRRACPTKPAHEPEPNKSPFRLGVLCREARTLDLIGAG